MPASRALLALTFTAAVAAACQHGPVLPDAFDEAPALRASGHTAEHEAHATEEASPYVGSGTRAAEDNDPPHGTESLASDEESPYMGSGNRTEDDGGDTIGSGT
jgi:hypothetical protein